MVKLFFAIVDVGVAATAARRVFPVNIEADQSVAELKKAIKAEKPTDLKDVDANNLQLFLAKKEGGEWLSEDEAPTIRDDFVPKGFKRMKNSLLLKNPENFGETFRPDEDQVHVLVLLLGPNTQQGRNQRHFNVPVQFSKREQEGGIPTICRIDRKATVATISSLLDRQLVVCIRAPPSSGKTTMCQLLYNHLIQSKPEALIAHVSANLMLDPDDFCGYFKSLYQCDFKTFSALKTDRVVLIDEAQLTYGDELLWLGYIKNTLDGYFPGLRFILFTSYGNFPIYGKKHKRSGLQIHPSR